MKINFKAARFIVTVCAIILNGVVFAQNPKKENAAMFRYNPALTGLTNERPVYKLEGIKYRFHSGGPIRSTPAAANGLLYFGSGDGYFYAINSQTGGEIWKFKTGGPVHSSPAVTTATAYFTSRDGYLYALQAANGKQRWKFNLGKDLGDENYWDNYLSSPVIDGNVLFVGSGSGYLYAFNTTTQKLLWRYNAGARIRTAPAISGNHVVFGANSGYVFDINKTTGLLQWKFATDGVKNTFESGDNDRKSIFCSPAIGDGVVVTGGRDGIVYAIDLLTGKERFRNDHKGPWILSAAIKDGTAFIGCGSDLLLQALDLKSGVEKWKLKLSSAIFSSISIAGDMLYFSDIDVNGNLHAVDSKTGTEVWRFPIGCKAFSTPVIKNGIIYCAGENGNLCALQGDMAASPASQVARKMVYWQEKNKKDYDYFRGGIDEYLRSYFVALGYQLVNSKELEEFMQDELTKKAPSVIVFPDNKFPDNISKAPSGSPLVRKYLDAGGKIALFGVNPLATVRDSIGRVIGFDDSIPGKIFDIKYGVKKNIRGLYINYATDTGNTYGLFDSFNSSSNFTVIIPDKSTEILARDEFGSVTEWLKSYGGPKGTGLLQLCLPQNEMSTRLPQIRAVIEYGVSW